MDGMRVTALVIALSVAAICALLAGFWWLARGKGVDQAVMTIACVFASAATLAIMILTFLQPD
ncbi:hypothetical protein [Nonomuraea sp. NPDC049625]|uniref:hypothetical protein n=1 Tax=Nonomuraea sp. NPDC049625 TaxID=3155775 RepID=UPI00343272B9